MTDEFVDLTDEYGNESRYRLYAARLPEFLKEYPPKGGYRVECGTTDLLSLQTGLLSLLKEAIAAGKKPGDLGLPGLDRALSTFVCTARLIDPQSRVLRTASACASLMNRKDYETLETAANQRLIASLDFGGTVFNQDEGRDFSRQGLTATPFGTADGPSAPISGSELRSPEVRSAPADLGGTGSQGTKAAPSDDDDDRDSVPGAMRIQVENLAKRLGQAIPVMKTQQDAENALRDLGKVKPRRQQEVAA